MKTFKFKFNGKEYVSTSPLVEYIIKYKNGNRLGKRKQKINFDKLEKSKIKYLDKMNSMYNIKEKLCI